MGLRTTKMNSRRLLLEASRLPELARFRSCLNFFGAIGKRREGERGGGGEWHSNSISAHNHLLIAACLNLLVAGPYR